MQRAKSLKILLLSLVLGVSTILGFTLMNNGTAKAESSSQQYFGYVVGEHVSSDIRLENDVVVVPMKNGDTVEVSNQLVVDDFGIKFTLPKNATSVEMIVKTDAYYVTGNKSVDGTSFEEEVEISLLLSVEEGQVYAIYNGGTKTNIGSYSDDMSVTATLKLNNNYLQATVGSHDVPSSDAIYYKVRNVDKVIADVGFKVTTEESYTDDVELKIEYIDQKVSDASGNYKQTFLLTEGAIATQAYPRYSLNDSFFARKESSEDIYVKDGEIYTLSPEIYSVTGYYNLVNTKIVPNGHEDSIWIGEGTSSRKISFNVDGASDLAFKFVDSEEAKIFEDYSVKVKSLDEDDKAPTYINDADALESFESALEKNLKTEYEVDDAKEEHYIRVGESQYLEIPSMENLVKDDLCSYSNMSYTVNYKNLTETSTYSSSLKVPVKFAGKYIFYVVFSDKSSNTMKSEDFYKLDEDNVTPIYGSYGNFVFDFEIEDDAPMSIETSTQGAGYKGVQYTAGKFTITASSYTVSYKLYYSATSITANDTGWVEVLSTSDISNGKTSDYFTEDELEAIAYDGSLTFTPDRLGYYKLVCDVDSSNSERSISESVIIEVKEEPTVVKPDSKWLQNNVWSVVFLSIGTLCLIAIIVLLCIKPKTETAEPEKKVKVKKSKKNKK